MAILRLKERVSQKMVASAGLAGPCSVVRELLDNAVDACGVQESHHVYVDVDDASGGLDYIAVRDNGGGIGRDDRKLACLNNTTSKIASVADLDSVNTCGFRGEALYLICQLAQRVEITSKTTEEATGETWRVGTNGLVEGGFRKVSAPTGTTVKVRGLFESTPVRYAFVRKARRKILEEIRDVVFGYALIHENITFHLKMVRVLPNGSMSTLETHVFPSGRDKINFFRTALGIRRGDALFLLGGEISVGGNAENYLVKIRCVFPRGTAAEGVTLKRATKVLCVNGRMLNVRRGFGRAVDKALVSSFADTKLIPPQMWYVELTFPNKVLDVNIEPEKNDVLVKGEEVMLESFKALIKEKLYDVHKDSLETTGEKIDMEENDDADLSMIATLNSVVSRAQSETCEAFGVDDDSDEEDAGESHLANDDEEEEVSSTGAQQTSSPLCDEAHNNDAVARVTGVADKPRVAETDNPKDNDTNDAHDAHDVNDAGDAPDVDTIDADDAPDDNISDWSHSMFEAPPASSEPIMSLDRPHLGSPIVAEQVVAHAMKDLKSERESRAFQTAPRRVPTDPPLGDTALLPLHTSPMAKPRRPNLGSHVTHHITASPKKRPRTQSQLPPKLTPLRVAQMARHIQNEVATVTVAITPPDVSRECIRFEESWIDRHGFPSNVLVAGADELYKTNDYTPEGRHLNTLGLVSYT